MRDNLDLKVASVDILLHWTLSPQKSRRRMMKNECYYPPATVLSALVSTKKQFQNPSMTGIRKEL